MAMAGTDPYQISNTKVIYDWLAEQTDSACVDAMLGWLPVLAADPHTAGTYVPSKGMPVVAAPTPVNQTVLVFVIVEQYHAVNLIRFDKI